MTGGPASWRLVLESYLCPTCGARPGEHCRTNHGNATFQPHAARGMHADRCPTCGTKVSAEPGAQCARCALVRALEVERATTWKRADP